MVTSHSRSRGEYDVKRFTDEKNVEVHERHLHNHTDVLSRTDRKDPFVNYLRAESIAFQHDQFKDFKYLGNSDGGETKDERRRFSARTWSPGKHLGLESASVNTFMENSDDPRSLNSAWKSRLKEGFNGNHTRAIRTPNSCGEPNVHSQSQFQKVKSQQIPARNSIPRTRYDDTQNPLHHHQSLHATRSFQVSGGGCLPGYMPLSSNISDKGADSSSHNSGQFNVKRRRIPRASMEALESEVCNKHKRRPTTASVGCKRESVFNSMPSKPLTVQKSHLGWSTFRRHRSFVIFAFNAALILCFSYLIFKVIFLKREIAQLQKLLEACTVVDVESTTMQSNERCSKIESEKHYGNGISRVALLVFSFLCVPFMLKSYGDKLRQLSKKSIAAAKDDAPLSKRIAYRVDVLFSTYPYMKAVALLLATLLLICGGGVALFAVSSDNLLDAMWRSWTYVADSGNHANSEGAWPRTVSVFISFGGMLIFALMLGLISDAISEKVDSLRKGKSEVIESGHTLILGWSDKLGSLLKQLAIANQSVGGGAVVVLAEKDKEEMELEITKLEFDFMGTSVICRSGSPLIMADLKKVSVSKARAIIVLAEVENADQSDARALRVVLSLAGVKEGLGGHIVVEMSDLDNEALVKLVGGEMVETVVAHDVIGRLMIQCARQPGLAQIWEDLLGFDKAEFYIKRWPQLTGMRFEDVLISFPEAIPCGVKIAAKEGRIVLNPCDDYIICDGDEILVIAEDDDTYAPAALPQVRESPLLQPKRSQKKPQKILLCGWRRDIEDMIKVLDAFLAPGSELWIFSDVPESDREKKLIYGNLNPDNLENIKLVHREGNTVIRRHLESLPLEMFDSILILADEKLEDTVENADSSSLATLLLIRDIQSKRLPLEGTRGSTMRLPGYSQSSWIREIHEASNQTIIISEILDSRTKNLVSVSKISDYVLSNELVSMALAMVAEDKQINRVLEELFAEEGNELYIRPAEFYLSDQEELSFFEIMIRARQREEIVVGYRRASADQAVINPPDKGVLQKWSLKDFFVVLALEE